MSLWWTMGVNQSYEGTRTAQAIINIALITGNIGRPGTGANSITGQCNAMGSRLWSNTTNLLGHHRFESSEDRSKVAEILGIPPERIPTRAGGPMTGFWQAFAREKSVDYGSSRPIRLIAGSIRKTRGCCWDNSISW